MIWHIGLFAALCSLSATFATGFRARPSVAEGIVEMSGEDEANTVGVPIAADEDEPVTEKHVGWPNAKHKGVVCEQSAKIFSGRLRDLSHCRKQCDHFCCRFYDYSPVVLTCSLYMSCDQPEEAEAYKHLDIAIYEAAEAILHEKEYNGFLVGEKVQSLVDKEIVDYNRGIGIILQVKRFQEGIVLRRSGWAKREMPRKVAVWFEGQAPETGTPCKKQRNYFYPDEVMKVKLEVGTIPPLPQVVVPMVDFCGSWVEIKHHNLDAYLRHIGVARSRTRKMVNTFMEQSKYSVVEGVLQVTTTKPFHGSTTIAFAGLDDHLETFPLDQEQIVQIQEEKFIKTHRWEGARLKTIARHPYRAKPSFVTERWIDKTEDPHQLVQVTSHNGVAFKRIFSRKSSQTDSKPACEPQ